MEERKEEGREERREEVEGGREGVVIRRSGVEKWEGKEKGREGEPCVVLCSYVCTCCV